MFTDREKHVPKILESFHIMKNSGRCMNIKDGLDNKAGGKKKKGISGYEGEEEYG